MRTNKERKIAVASKGYLPSHAFISRSRALPILYSVVLSEDRRDYSGILSILPPSLVISVEKETYSHIQFANMSHSRPENFVLGRQSVSASTQIYVQYYVAFQAEAVGSLFPPVKMDEMRGRKG